MTAIAPPVERGRTIAMLAILLWLAFVGLIFWHDRSEHPIAAAEFAKCDICGPPLTERIADALGM